MPCAWVIMCIHLFFCVCACLPHHLMARVVVCPHLSPPSPHLLFLLSFVGRHLTFSSSSSSARPFLPPYFSLRCQFPPLSSWLCARHSDTSGGRGCRPYANDPTLCKSALLLIKSQMQIQLADWTEREVEGFLGSNVTRVWKKKSPKTLCVCVRKNKGISTGRVIKGANKRV